MIKLVNLTKCYRNFRAVDHVDLSVERGSIFGFLGPNGAGKTTTIKMMAGILRPTEGRIIINGMDLFQEPSKVKRCIGFIPDRPFLYEKLTGSEFLQFMAKLYRLDAELSSGRRAVRLLQLFELEHWADELIESYSHGMKQRLVMCAALLHKPDIIIVDEPMVGLDPKAASLVKDVFRDQALAGATVFMSTHSLEVAAEVCSRIAIIQEGRIIATGTAEELRHQAGVDGNLENIFLTLTAGKTLAHDRSRFAS
jgi:ABC-2 type transport system ATP-binding protein